MSRDHAIASALSHFDSGDFRAELAKRVAIESTSQEASHARYLDDYLRDAMTPALERLGCTVERIENPVAGGGPFLIAHRHEGKELPTVLMYGHGDVVRGHEGKWRDGRSPWVLDLAGERWYGRGTADNKGQHSVNLAALECVLAARGRLGFNLKCLIETSEETGSPGLREFCAAHREVLQADVLIASDGPRLTAEQPTLFLGSRGIAEFSLAVDLREGGHHSGNWGGLLRNPATVLANAIACLMDARGRILVEGLRPPPIPAAVGAAIRDLEVGGGPDDPAIDEGWGEPGLTPGERVFGWNALEVLAMGSGNPERPVNAIPPAAIAHLHLRFVVGTDWQHAAEHVRGHLDAHGFDMVRVRPGASMPATRVSPDHPWVKKAIASLERTTGRGVVVLPNLGGTLPNDVFADILGMPTIWVPHSYPGCSQHAPDEHLLAPLAREGLAMMTGLFWDVGEPLAAA
jgi:acetylornithine deacetylase/succinyl-diaminopimelate desuccinylase-like protein